MKNKKFQQKQQIIKFINYIIKHYHFIIDMMNIEQTDVMIIKVMIDEYSTFPQYEN